MKSWLAVLEGRLACPFGEVDPEEGVPQGPCQESLRKMVLAVLEGKFSYQSDGMERVVQEGSWEY